MSQAVPFSTIAEMFQNLVDRYAKTDKPLLQLKIDGTYRSLTYSDVYNDVSQLYHAFRGLGIGRGDRIALLSENRPEWVITDLAAQFHAAVDVPIFPSQTAAQIEFILADSEARAIVVSNRFQLAKVVKIRENLPHLKHVIVMSPVDDMPPGVLTFEQLLSSGTPGYQANPNALKVAAGSVNPDDLCTIIYTSGTTGNPKGVMLTHANFVSNILATHQVIDVNDRDVLLSFLPLCHVFERMGGYYLAFSSGATIAYAESIDSVANNMLEVKPTLVVAVPRLFERIYNRIARMVEKDSTVKRKIFYAAVATGRKYAEMRKQGKPSVALRAQHAMYDRLVFKKLQARTGGRIRFFVSGGAALPRELGEFFEAVGLVVLEGYGLTESSPVISVNPLGDHRFGSVGRPIPGVEVKIAPDGEILTRGPHVMKGYFNNRKATDEAIDRDGWLYTGDVGLFDEHGFLHITDRKKHLFVSSGGKNIAPQPIESLFVSSEFIDQFMLIGDKRMYLTALIVPDFDALRAYADSHGIAYKTNVDLVNNTEVYKLFESKLQATQRDLANFEKVRRFTLLEQAFSIENGEMTPSLKIRRKAVEERYSDLIESMYRT